MPVSAAIVVTYHPQGDLADRLGRLSVQVDHLIIVDNHSSEQDLQLLREIIAQYPHGSLIANNENVGIACALNQGMTKAQSLGAKWVLTMDQDTLAEPDMTAVLLATVAEFDADNTPGVVAANFIDSTGKSFDASQTDAVQKSTYHQAHTAITSGSLINMAAWQAVSGFREDFFIDSVDHDFCFRLRQDGWKIIQSHCPLMHHQLGDTTRRANFLLLHPAIANYAPVRRYYMTRNRIAMLKAHWKHEPRWVFKELAMIAADAILITLYEKKRVVKLKAMLKGLCDGMLGRMGPQTAV